VTFGTFCKKKAVDRGLGEITSKYNNLISPPAGIQGAELYKPFVTFVTFCKKTFCKKTTIRKA